jgi:hypothetical protein
MTVLIGMDHSHQIRPGDAIPSPPSIAVDHWGVAQIDIPGQDRSYPRPPGNGTSCAGLANNSTRAPPLNID